MIHIASTLRVKSIWLAGCAILALPSLSRFPQAIAQTAPAPLVKKGMPVDWWFVFKFNAHAFPGCGGAEAEKAPCCFGGTLQKYDEPHEKGRYSQQYVYASNKQPSLRKGTGCVGRTLDDPLGATFSQVYNGSYHYVLWNDQFYGRPIPSGSSPWGHSKGVVAWNEAGEGFVMQVSTPSWPASGSKDHPREHDGNTLGCVLDDDVEVSQHFFCLKLTRNDLVKVLKALAKASVLTDLTNPKLVNNGGPRDVQGRVKKLGKRIDNQVHSVDTLSTGVKLISKPSKLHVPPWQLVSASLESLPLRVASWWAHPQIPSTDASQLPGCWCDGLGEPGSVQIALSGEWQGKTFSLRGGSGLNYNHAKFGVSTQACNHSVIFGDMNQQGAIEEGYVYPNQKCSSSQNGRGGTFYVLENEDLWKSVSELIKGTSAPLEPPMIREHKEVEQE